MFVTYSKNALILDNIPEVYVDEQNGVWLMLDFGSQSIGNVLGQRHIEMSKELTKLGVEKLPASDLAHRVKQA